MKEIIISIKSNWIKEIIYNNKILELRKSYPKCQLPLKAYIYCTKSGNDLQINNKLCNGYIIGEMIINNIYKININDNDLIIDNKKTEWEKLENFSKVNKQEIKKYFNKNKGYGWQISKFEIYENYIKVEKLLGKNYDSKCLMSWCFIN